MQYILIFSLCINSLFTYKYNKYVTTLFLFKIYALNNIPHNPAQKHIRKLIYLKSSFLP